MQAHVISRWVLFIRLGQTKFISSFPEKPKLKILVVLCISAASTELASYVLHVSQEWQSGWFSHCVHWCRCVYVCGQKPSSQQQPDSVETAKKIIMGQNALDAKWSLCDISVYFSTFLAVLLFPHSFIVFYFMSNTVSLTSVRLIKSISITVVVKNKCDQIR